ncbi:long-chain fatty acid--CoA ligase [Iamia sp. SCSIO 61187]|uniref:class I adenylate-forming enzyme family protein n=1 Tax=Iamia sp. SCSIO 61187 TaxID=2722752 RepID=UPI001C625815|nr:AMP-binding protein [Iamia sp. SCSIO 61187]QYG91276.1 long-chain fatty acid--CoA ligase [Iamia sp. SCSIO 61187]
MPGLGRARKARLAFDHDLTLAAVFDRLAETGGDQVLVDEQDGDVRTLADAADQVARWAGGLEGEIEPGGIVVVATPNGYDQLLLCAAVSRAGGLPAPVNDRLRPDEIDHIVADAGATLVLRSAADVPAGGSRIDTAPDLDAKGVGAVFYTSGTTGRPKGAELSHRALVGQMNRMALVPGGLGRHEAVFSLPMAHIMGFVVALGLAYAHIPARFLPRFRAEAILDEIEERRASVFVGVPTMYRMLLDAGAEDRDLTSVRVWISGADAMPSELADRFSRMGALATLPGGRTVGRALFAEGYGMVETGGSGALKLDLPGLPDSVRRLGVPVPGYKTRVVGEDGAEVARGQVGELQLSGPGVLKGYRGAEDATGDLFTDDGWLRTGDLVRRGPLGAFAFEGRAKDIIVRGGYNVYAVEVEQALERHDAVAEAAVVGLPDDRLGEVPVAAVRLCPGATAEPEEIRAFAQEQLSSYKVPSEVLIVDELPQSGTRKVQRAEVRDLFTDD